MSSILMNKVHNILDMTMYSMSNNEDHDSMINLGYL
jgi:hypothetical protein